MQETHIAYEDAHDVSQLVLETNKSLNEYMSEYNELQELQVLDASVLVKQTLALCFRRKSRTSQST